MTFVDQINFVIEWEVAEKTAEQNKIEISIATYDAITLLDQIKTCHTIHEKRPQINEMIFLDMEIVVKQLNMIMMRKSKNKFGSNFIETLNNEHKTYFNVHQLYY